MQLKEGIITLGRHIEEKANINLFKVKVMPDMEGIKEIDYFPEYPNFFISDNIAYQPDDVVWLICSDDYHSGYIIGLKQPAGGEGLTAMYSMISAFETACSLPITPFDKMSIERFSDNCIVFSDLQNNTVGHIYNNKVIILISKSGTVYVKNPVSTITISDSGGISVKGKVLNEEFTSETVNITGSSNETVGSKSIVSNGKFKLQASGDLNESTSSNHGVMVAGEENHLVGKKLKETVGLGVERKIVAGGESTTINVGEYSINVLAGGISFTTAAGMIKMSASLAISISSKVAVNISAPIVKMPSGLVTPTGSGPFCALPFCLMSGAPHCGNMMAGG